MVKITWIKDLGKRIYLTFKLWRTVLFSVLFLSLVLGTNLLWFIPSEIRLALALVYLILTEIMAFSIVRLITDSTVQIISNVFYNRKHKPEKLYLPRMRQIAKKMGMKYNKPITITENPSIKSPSANIFTRNITFPKSWMKRFHATERDAIIGHELAHIKCAPKFVGELLLVTLITWIFAFLLATITWNLTIYVIAELAFMMLLFSYVLRRNEFRADWESANATTPEALISVFEYLKAEYKRDDGSETHPPLQARIKQLMRLLNSDEQHSGN
jgi:Zn-dependent protease with chaperone function